METIYEDIKAIIPRDIAGVIFSYLPQTETLDRKWRENAFGHEMTVAASPDGKIVVCSCEQLHVFSSHGDLLHAWEVGAYQYAPSLCVSPSGEIFIIDADHRCLNVFTPAGTPLYTWKMEDRFTDMWVGNISIHGNVTAMSNYHTGEISVVTSTGEFLAWDNPDMHAPKGIAVYNGNIYVTYLSRPYVFVYTQGGKLLRQWEIKIHKHLACPGDVSVSPHNVFVSVGTCIQVFTHDGVFLRAFGEGDFKHIHTFTVSPHGKVFATDKYDKDIRVYTMPYM